MREIPEKSTPIINEIIEKLAKVRLSAYEFNIIFAIIRKTYGWDKSDDWISGSQLSELTEISKEHCFHILKKLLLKRIIIKKDKNIGLNKHTDQWVLPIQAVRKQAVPIEALSTAYSGSGVLPIEALTKETITKETIQKKGTPLKKVINGESYRGKYEWFDNFLDRCKKKTITPNISPKKYDSLQTEYSTKVLWTTEVQGCIDWCFDNDKKIITAQRLRNRMKNTIKWGKERERKRLEDQQDKKTGIVKHSTPRQAQKLYDCTMCANTMTANTDMICNSCQAVA